ncbi:hypothetical protein AVEN_91178-1 [Araneus ventricosus]|uniref:Uncharacterized protein n=1 Tax=Araneus ventricosus TaxID=182803 RepID=A0A4Y2VB21_ARAVE|nr:hypothetical protein AVEN_91178-1 [Araneus ventricosus]
MDDQSPNARKKSVSANTEAFRFSSVKQDSATGMDSTIPTFSFSPATLFPDQEDIPYSCNYEDETESSLSASISMPQGDQEITAHSSCDENVRKEEIASGSSSSTDESGNLGCTSAQESSHKNVLDKA